MNNEIRQFFLKNNLIIKKITIKGKVIIITTDNKSYVIKKNNHHLDDIFKYLKSRSFTYIPKIINQTNNYNFYEYINDIRIPKEEKAIDIFKITANLHNKTTFYKDIDENYYKEIYEDTINEIDYLENYYNDLAEIFEKEELMSPSHYLLIRNITKIFISLNYAKYSIEKWYKIINDKKRIRVVNIHNNLTLDHYLISDKPYLISWEKSKRDIPIYDILKMYKKYYSELDFLDLLKNYETSYPWLIEEKKLFFSLISLPPKIEFNNTEYKMCKNIRELYNYLNTTQKLISDYFPPKKESIK